MVEPGSISEWNAAIEALPARHPRRVGRVLVWLGAGAAVVGMFLTPPWANIGLGVGFAGILLARAPVHRLPAVAVGIAFAAWLLLSAGLAVARGQPHSGHLPGVVHAWLCLPLAAAAAVDARWRCWAVRALAVIAIASAIVAALQFCIGLGTGPLRIDPAGERFSVARGFTALHLTLGFAGALLAALATQPEGALAAGRAWTSTARVAAAVILAVSGSRAALVGGLAGIGAGFATRGRRWLLLGVAIAVVLAGLVAARMAASDHRRLEAMLSGRNGRWPIWATSLTLIREHPVVGLGSREAYMHAYNPAFAATLPGAKNEFADTDGAPHAHSWPLALVAEHGVPAVLLHLGLVGAVLVACWRRRRDNPAGWSTAVAIAATGLAAGLFEPFPTQAVPGAAFHACLGIALGIAHARTAPGVAGADPRPG